MVMVNRRAWVVATSLLFISAGLFVMPCASHGQSLSGISLANASSADEEAVGLFDNPTWERESGVQTLSSSATQFQTRYSATVSADCGIACGGRNEVLDTNYTVSFNASAPGAYRLTVSTQRVGDLNRIDEGGGDADSDIGAVACTPSGGTVESGACTLTDPGACVGGGGGCNVPFDQSNSLTVFGVSNGSPVAHSLNFTWTQRANSDGTGLFTNADEAAVRLGRNTDDGTNGSAAYPGSPSRTESNDGHFVTVTLTSLCGNGVIDTGPSYAEECDEGVLNGGASCCETDCTITEAGEICRGLAGGCDAAETCDGVSSDCPTDAFQPGGTVCRAGSTGDLCDLDETCSGTGADCPPDGVEPAGTVCRAQAGACDIEETCDGVGKTCPPDAVEPAGTTCRVSAGVCDVDEECDGIAKTCPTDGFVSAGTSCRSAIDVCDVEEACTGSSADCPPDDVEAAGTLCRAAAGDCDVEETCDGVGTACPADDFELAGVVCRSVTAGDLCDLEETCTGSSADCPPDAVEPAGTVCRAVADVCDVEEQCDGVGKSCPSDAVESAGVTCRPVAGDCDVEEQCDGVAVACPSDGFVAGGTSCRAAVDVCDAEETCTGSSADCPADGVEPNGTLCRAAADLCDAAETCDGIGTACPADGVASAGTECRAAAGVCDVAEQCDGVAASCPADGVASAGTTCRAAAGECDVAEDCDGVAADCPTDVFVADGTTCSDDGLFCTGDESCQSGLCVGDGDPCGMAACDEINDQCVTVGCGAAPLNGCRTAAKSILLYKNKSPDKRDKLIYKWIKGQTSTQADFADPINSAQYDLCLYAGTSAALIYEANVPPSASKWKTLSDKGFKYKDSNLSEDGTQRIVLKGRDGNKSKLLWKGKGDNLPEAAPSSLPIAMGDFPVVVQVINNDNGMCFETTFDAADVKKNEVDQLRLKDQ
jgi:hypothetical protein